MKDIEGYEGLYAVTQEGQVWSYPRKGTGGHSGKWLKSYSHKDYFYVALCKNGKVKTQLIHRLVAKTLVPNPNNFPVVNHKNEKKSDNRVENLEWCTPLMNVRHSVNRGNFPIGERSPHCKLTDANVREIRELRSQGVLLRILSKRFGVDMSHIAAVANGHERKRVI